MGVLASHWRDGLKVTEQQKHNLGEQQKHNMCEQQKLLKLGSIPFYDVPDRYQFNNMLYCLSVLFAAI